MRGLERQVEKQKVDINASRNYGLDMLKMLSMFMVVILHILCQGGVYANTIKMSFSYEIAWLLEIMCFCAVNCFGLISGYVGIKAKFSLSKLFYLWVMVAFYTLLLTCFFVWLYPEKNDLQHWLRVIFPVTTNQYWYFSAYFLMYFFTPIFNKVVNELEERKLVWLSVVLILIFSVWQIFMETDVCCTEDGYSALWLSVLYILGGTVRRLRHKIQISKKTAIIIYVLGVSATWGWKAFFERINYSKVDPNMWINYISPTILFCALGLILYFEQLNISNCFLKRAIILGAPHAFGVYLLHTQPYIISIVLPDKFAYLATYSAGYMMFGVIIFAVGIYILCTTIDMMRSKLFEWIKIKQVLKFIDKTLTDKNILFY
mgnify:CR=1 FL=1